MTADSKEHRLKASQKLEQEFDEELFNAYQRADIEAHYKATRFFQMLNDHRGVQTAKILLHSPHVSDGYTALYLRGRLDLAVEAIIHGNPKWHPLFTPGELKICEDRLRAYGYIK